MLGFIFKYIRFVLMSFSSQGKQAGSPVTRTKGRVFS